METEGMTRNEMDALMGQGQLLDKSPEVDLSELCRM
jgi:hypothetical protein